MHGQQNIKFAETCDLVSFSALYAMSSASVVTTGQHLQEFEGSVNNEEEST